MTISYRQVLVTIQGVPTRMFTTTLRSQPVYSRSRLSELDHARESSRINIADSDNVLQPRRHPDRWFHCLTDPPTYLNDAIFHSLIFYAYAKWKVQTSVTPGRQH